MLLPLRPSGTSPFFDRGGVFDAVAGHAAACPYLQITQ